MSEAPGTEEEIMGVFEMSMCTHLFFQDWYDKADDKKRSSSYCLGVY